MSDVSIVGTRGNIKDANISPSEASRWLTDGILFYLKVEGSNEIAYQFFKGVPTKGSRVNQYFAEYKGQPVSMRDTERAIASELRDNFHDVTENMLDELSTNPKAAGRKISGRTGDIARALRANEKIKIKAGSVDIAYSVASFLLYEDEEIGDENISLAITEKNVNSLNPEVEIYISDGSGLEVQIGSKRGSPGKQNDLNISDDAIGQGNDEGLLSKLLPF